MFYGLFVLAMAFSSVHASDFTETDIGGMRRRAEQAQADAESRDYARVIGWNHKLFNAIPPFAREHRGLVSDPSCNARPYPLKIGNEPWYDYQPLSTIDRNAVWQIMNCNVVLNDGYQCTLNYYSVAKQSGTAAPVFHCKRAGEDREFSYRH